MDNKYQWIKKHIILVIMLTNNVIVANPII